MSSRIPDWLKVKLHYEQLIEKRKEESGYSENAHVKIRNIDQ